MMEQFYAQFNHSIDVILRAWCYDSRPIVQQIQASLGPYLNKIIIVTHDTAEQYKHDCELISQTTHELFSGTANVVVTSHEAACDNHKMWSTALNVGFNEVSTPYTLCISGEAKITTSAINHMLDALTDGALVTGPHYTGFDTVQNAEVTLGESYNVIRNTCALWQTAQLKSLAGPFSTLCDGGKNSTSSGMEDVLACMMLYAKSPTSFGVIVPISIPLHLGVRYPQKDKEYRELHWLNHGLVEIFKDWAKQNNIEIHENFITEFYEKFYRQN
jgi:hypothetical protein